MAGPRRGVLFGRLAFAFLLSLVLGPSLLAAEAPSYADELVARARQERLWARRPWLVLGHYRRDRFGRLESQAAGAGFFLAKDGKTDPQAELEATLRAFFAPVPEGPREQQAQCRFPARYHWLSARLRFDAARLPVQGCRRFDEWRGAIDASGATLIFADAYFNNPGSMYGHTFLKLRRRAALAGEDLLDYTVNFAGTPDTNNGFLYALKGISGGFPGNFSTLPYYMKVQEYTNLESRDLWEYDLAFSQDAIDQMLRHAWELGGTYFDYYFFSENCSYQLLTLLDAADPDLHLADGFGFGVIPSNTLRAVLSRPGLVKGARYRPSHAAQMKTRRARLSAGEARAAGVLGRAPSEKGVGALSVWPKERQALVLDSAHDLFRFRAGFSNELSAEAARGERLLLVARGRLAQPPLPVEPSRPASPEDGHATMRVGAGAGTTKRSAFEEVRWRGALHDLASQDDGYVPGSQLEMLDLRLRFDNLQRDLYVERLDLVNIASLAPWDPWVRKPSWKASAGIDQAKELGCQGSSCMYFNVNAGGGLSAAAHWTRRREYFYLIGEGDLGLGPVLERDWRIGAGGTAGLIVDLASFWRVTAEATEIAYQQGPRRERMRVIDALRLSKAFELRVTLDRRVPDSEAGAALLFYF